MMLSNLNKRILFVVTIFVLITLCSFVYILKNQKNKQDSVILLRKIHEELTKLKKRNTLLRKLIVTDVQEFVGDIPNYKVPTFEYESLRRKVVQDIQEFWYFINSKITELKNQPNVDTDTISTANKILLIGFEYKRALINNMKKLIEVDGFNDWRNSEITDLSNIIQTRLYYLQNPANCKNAKKLVCTINYSCGFGCQMHHLISCLILAYGMQRSLVLQSTGWQYHKDGWNKIFMPLSNHCTTIDNKSIDEWPGSIQSKAIRIPTTISPRSQFKPWVVPKDLITRLKVSHGNPIVWWIGQILKYIWKPQNLTLTYINNKMEELKIKSPFVGIHVRRTDKLIKEASYHAIEEYMVKVDEYYNLIETNINITKKRVYIATDDFNVIREAKTKYSHYEILYNPNIPKLPKTDSLHRNDNLLDVILDIHILSLSNFLVCTFSSNICRLTYELMQNNYVDASLKTFSLDFVYFYSEQKYNKRKVILNHKAQMPEEIDLLTGDIIHIDGNYQDGYSLGTNLRTKQKGVYPSFKVEIEPEIAEFPTYSKINNREIIL